MKRIKRIKILICIFMIMTALTFAGCADQTVHDGEENAHQTQTQTPVPESKDDSRKEETQQQPAKPDAKPETETEPETKSETESEMTTDNYGPVKVSQIDYDSFQSRMTDEEWEGFKQYFPVLKENAAFELTDFGEYTALDKDGSITEDSINTVFRRYDPKETTDLSRYVKAYAENDIEEMMIREVRVFDLDQDGIQELIVEWTPVGDFLVLHCENEKFYGWEIMYRGFEVLQTSGVYLSSGGAACNHWKHIRFDSGSWIEETLAVEDWGEYYISGEAVDEDTYLRQIDTYQTGDVTGYEPKRCVDEITG